MIGIPRSLGVVLSLALALGLLAGRSIISPPMALGAHLPLQITEFTARSLDGAGDDYTVAGGHPFEAATSFSLVNPADVDPVELIKSVVTELPPGFVANLAGTERCTMKQISPAGAEQTPACPAGSEIGYVDLEAGNGGVPFPRARVYNMVPERGYPAQLAFNVLAKVVVLYPQLRPRTGDYGVTVSSPGVTNIGAAAVKLSLYGVPSQRNGTGGAPIPLVSNPANCQEAEPTTKLLVDSWEFPGRTLDPGSSDFGSPDVSDPNWKTATAIAPAVTGCDSLALASQFAPTIDARPTPGAGSSQADAPSGYTVNLDFPQSNDPTDSSSTFDPSIPSPPPLKNATVTLPAGVAISPSAADGLEGCSDQASDPSGDQVHYDTTNPVTCPEASKIGSVVTTSPLLALRDPTTDQVIGADPVGGDVYVLKPHPGDLGSAGQDGTFRVLIDVSSVKYGINVKLPGTVTAAKNTGQLSATFLENPQLPVKHLQLSLKPGPRAPLANPSTCGTFTTTTDLVPWSTPGTPDARPSASFGITEGAGGSPCASTPQQLPFAPSMSAGNTQTGAGAPSPFTLDLSRGDSEQELHNISVSMPKGFTAKLTGIPYCSEAAIAAASGRSGKDEQANPSCSSASQIGTLTTGAGPGSNPYYVSGKAYLAGPYKGGSLSLVFITPAVAGPFDLGNVVIRAAAYIDPLTAQVSVRSDDIPQMLDGVRLQIRHVSVSINRDGFVLNPTSCDPMAINGTIVGGAQGGVSEATSTRFQASGCAALKLTPKFSASISTGGAAPAAKASKAMIAARRGKAAPKAKPASVFASKANGIALHVTLSEPSAPLGTLVNLAKVKVELPKALPSRLTTLQKACTAVQFSADPAGCPAASVVGQAKVITPLLPVPLTGPAYFVSHGGEAFPSLTMVLQGYGITIDLVGTTFISKSGITSTTFKTVPDVPFNSFELTLPQGKDSALTGNGDLCKSKLVMPTEYVAQNGGELHQSNVIAVAGCTKAKALTRAQKLAAALKACKRKAKSKRATCQRAARKKYGVKAKNKQ